MADAVSDKPRVANSHAKPKIDAPPSIPATVQYDIHSIANALETANQKRPSAAEESRAKRNLQAQEDTTYWAKWMFWVALGETLVTGLGVFLVWRTLLHTRSAAQAARDAVTAQENATEVTKAQISAYVKIDSAEIALREHDGIGYGIHPQLIIKASNSGNSQAIAFRWNVRSLYMYPGADPAIRGNTGVPPENWGVALASRDTVEQRTNCLPSFFTERDIGWLVKNEITAFFEVEIVYRNIFEKDFRDKSTFACAIRNGGSGQYLLRRHPMTIEEMSRQMVASKAFQDAQKDGSK